MTTLSNQLFSQFVLQYNISTTVIEIFKLTRMLHATETRPWPQMVKEELYTKPEKDKC